jgi:hypothetical protein
MNDARLAARAKLYPLSGQSASPTVPWAFVDPFGIVTSIASTSTHGLQEAIATCDTNGWPLLVHGAGTMAPTSQITIPAGFKKLITIEASVTIQPAALGSSDIIVIDSQENSEIRLHCGINQHSGDTGACVAIRPTNTITATGNLATSCTVIECFSVAAASGGGGLLLDPTSGGINGNPITCLDPNAGVYGIKCLNPGSAFIAVENNIISWAYMHKQTGFGIAWGTGTTNQTSMRENIFIGTRIATNGASAVGFSSYGSYDTILGLAADNEEGTLNQGVVFGSGATGNFARFNARGAGTAYVDSGTNNILVYNGQIIIGGNAVVTQSEGTWTPTWGGFSSALTGGAATYVKIGKMVFCNVNGFSAGTSNATTKTITLPFASKNSAVMAGMGHCMDNGAFQNNPMRIDTSASSTTANLYKDLNADAWTASGSCVADFAFWYVATS